MSKQGFAPKVIKRDGQQVEFDADKIRIAIQKAGLATGEFGEAEAFELTRLVVVALERQGASIVVHVEGIQDTVEDVLLSAWRKTGRAYIVYREQHAQMRVIGGQMKNRLVESYLGKMDWQVTENANMSYSLQGLNNYVASEVTKNYWIERVYPREVGEAHRQGAMHIHDLSLLAVYCVGWDLADLLTVGFKGAPGKIETAPAKHFRAALGQIVNFFYTLQGESAGAQAFSSLDTYMAPFIRVDGLGYREVKQSIQEFVFGLNVPTRVGFQTPFTNVTLDLQVPSNMKDEPVIVGGERQESTYGEYQAEMDMFNQAFLEVMTEGDAKGRVFTFPIPTYNITSDFDYDDHRMDLLWKVTARYGIPYFANYINSDLSPEDARSMCCRLRLDTRKLSQRGGGLFGANPLTGSIGVVTLNLPRLAHFSKDEPDFFSHLDHLVDLAAKSLEIKRKMLERLTDRQLYPYTKFYLRSIKESQGEYWSNHFSTVGLVGLNEASVNLLGKGIDQEDGRAFGLKVLDHLRERLTELQQSTGHAYNLEATPAESTSYRLAMMDKEELEGACCANEDAWKKGAEPFYTNSSQLPVDYSEDIFEVLDHQDDFQSRYTGGTVQHVFVGEAISDPTVIKHFVKQVFQQYRLPYISVTPTFSVCPEHGFIAGEYPHCPTCGLPTEVYSRVVGYLRPVGQWNAGKQAEFERRSSFMLSGGPQ